MQSIRTTTAPIWSATARRAAEPLRVGGLALAIVALEFLLARGIAAPEIAHYVFLFLGLFVFAAVFRFPLATAMVFFFFTDFVFYSTYYAHNVGALSVRPHEVILACLMIVAAVRPQRRTWGGRTGAALAVFLALVACSAALAVLTGTASLTEAFNNARPLSLLCMFYVVVRLFPEPRERFLLLSGLAVFAAVTGVVSLLVALGAGFGSSLQAPGSQAVFSQEGLGSVKRVRLGGLSAAYALFWLVVVQIATRRGLGRFVWALLLGGITLAIAVSFNRNMWLGLVIGAVVMAVLGGAMLRRRMAFGIALAVAGLTLFLAIGASSTETTVVKPILARGDTLLNPGKTEKEGSLQSRGEETEKAWAVAQHHLLIGVGAGTEFGVFRTEPVTSGSFTIGVKQIPQLYLHNQYLYLVLIAGVPGLVAFVIFLGGPIALAFRRRPRDPAIVACGVGLLLIMISSVVAIYFTVDDMTPVLGLLAGVLIADAEGRAARGEPAGLTP